MPNRSGRRMLALLILAGVLIPAVPASAHDHRIFDEPRSLDVRSHPITKIAPANRSAVAVRASLAGPKAGAPKVATTTATLTRNPDTPLVKVRDATRFEVIEPAFTTPAEECVAPVCSEMQVDVAAGGKQTLYARASWPLANYYVHIWGIAPDNTVVGRADVAESFDKETGNERTIPVAEFTVPNPQAGTWRIQTRAVFGYQIPVTTTVALAAGPPVEYKRLGVRELADKYLTQHVSVNIVFAGRQWSPEEVAAFRDRMPLEYRTGVLAKQGSDCTGPEDSDQNAVLNWAVCHYSGTRSPDARGSRPYFEPIRFTYDYSFLEADETWTRDLFTEAKRVTTLDAPFDDDDARNYLALYDAHQGKRTRSVGTNAKGPAYVVTNPTVSDKIDAFAVEDWIFASRRNARYARSFRDLETGGIRDASFITNDPGAAYDPFYSRKGRKDLETMPQGPATSFTFFVLDTYSPTYAAEYFRPNAYHHWDVSEHMIDPDTLAQDGPDWARVWGGRYRFFFHDLGAGPNHYEAIDFFLGVVPGSAAKPYGDPPIWDYETDSDWSGKLVERTARDFVTMLLYRFSAPYLYRPLPADVYFLSSSNWSDCYSRPECGPDGVSHTILEKIYQPSYVEKNLASALPGATFLTERSDPRLKTYRYLGCAQMRAVSNREGEEPILVPDPNCTGPGDEIQGWLELAKARGDDAAGLGVNDFGASGNVIRRLVEENRDLVAPLRPGQLLLTNISVVFPGATTWYLPAIVGGVALGTPNDEIWGILNNTNDRAKTHKATDCAKSRPFAPGCNNVPPVRDPGGGFSYTVQHEASHFLGLLHPHDSLTVDKDVNGKWQYYGSSYRHYGDSSMAPTTYAGAFTPYSVLDQDIIQRGHTAEYLRMTEDHLADAHMLDGITGLSSPSALTRRKVAEAGAWRSAASAQFACGDYLASERAMRNAFLASQGIFGPVVNARQLKPGERVLFEVTPQRSYGPRGLAPKGCSAAASMKRPPDVLGDVRGRPPLPVTGTGDAPMIGMLLIVLAVALRRARGRSA